MADRAPLTAGASIRLSLAAGLNFRSLSPGMLFLRVCQRACKGFKRRCAAAFALAGLLHAGGRRTTGLNRYAVIPIVTQRVNCLCIGLAVTVRVLAFVAVLTLADVEIQAILFASGGFIAFVFRVQHKVVAFGVRKLLRRLALVNLTADRTNKTYNLSFGAGCFLIALLEVMLTGSRECFLDRLSTLSAYIRL